MLEKYLKEIEFDSYEDMRDNLKIDVPDDFNFAYDVLDEWAKSEPEKTAVVWCNPLGEEKRISFQEMSEMSNKFANVLTKCGIGKGDIVTLILKRRWEFWPTIMACHKVGAIVVPINHLMKKKDFVYRFTAIDVKAVVCVDEKMVIDEIEMAFHLCPGVHTKIIVGEKRDGWLGWQEEVDAASGDWIRPSGDLRTKNDDVMIMYYTSGTTGMPKVVAHDYTYPLGHIITAKYWLRCENNGLHLTISDTGWAKSVWGKLYGQWICGSAVFVYDYDRFVAKEMLELIQNYKINTFCAPPTIYRFFVKEDLSAYDFSQLHHASTAGEALHSEVFHVFKKITGLKIYEAYGQTEAVVLLGSFPGVDPKPGSMGKPSPLYDIDIIDDNLNSLDDGEDGHLVIKIDDNKHYPLGLFKGYIYDDEMTRDKIRDGYYFTGDMAWRDENGYYWFVGRSDDLIKTSGYRVGPFEVESVLMEHPSVIECAITGAPDPVRGQVVKATIVLANGYEASDELAEELRNYVKKNTAPYKYPRIIDFVSELPKTFSGKIRRVDIRKKTT